MNIIYKKVASDLLIFLYATETCTYHKKMPKEGLIKYKRILSNLLFISASGKSNALLPFYQFVFHPRHSEFHFLHLVR